MTNMRKCIGSTKFGLEAHEAPPDEPLGAKRPDRARRSAR